MHEEGTEDEKPCADVVYMLKARRAGNAVESFIVECWKDERRCVKVGSRDLEVAARRQSAFVADVRKIL